MQIARKAASFLSALMLSISSHAATLTPEQGIVLVNQGSGYVNAQGPTTVKLGDIVVVNPGGSAALLPRRLRGSDLNWNPCDGGPRVALHDRGQHDAHSSYHPAASRQRTT
jgi:hypothetical protein